MHIVVLVLVEVLIVISLSRLVGLAFRWIRQPLVIGEIVAGIMLGPSLFGLIAPGVAAALFPAEAVPYLNVLSQVGLIFFMFLVGLELNPKYLKDQIGVAVLTSHVSILVPFAMGIVLALLLYPLVSTQTVSFTAFALFIGSAMSITAFPVLARIITENNLQQTRLGTLALTCAAVDDITAWCLLALAIAVAKSGNMIGAIPTILLALLYVALMLTLGRKFLSGLSKQYDRTGRLSQYTLAAIYMGVLVSALSTEQIGIHLIFGAFLMGALMPKNAGLTHALAVRTEDFVLTFLLPIFFAYSGLRTQIGLLNQPELWLLAALVLAVAISGKYFGTYSAARFCGINHREASALGWLMNTRGLTELIVLNIGLSLNVISPLMFTMLVIMALVTTFMTSPLLEWTYPKRAIRLDVLEPESPPVGPSYNVVVPIANPGTQQGLLQLATALAGSRLQPSAVYLLSLIELPQEYSFEATPAEVDRWLGQRREQMQQLVAAAISPETSSPASATPLHAPKIYPLVQVADDVAQEACQIALVERADLIVVGWHRPTFSSNRLGGRVGQILSHAQTDVAVFVDRGSEHLRRLLVPYAAGVHDDLGLELALRLLMEHDDCTLTVLRVREPGEQEPELSYEFQTVLAQLPEALRSRVSTPVTEASDPLATVVKASTEADLTIAGASREWGLERQTLGRHADELAVECKSSLLIARKYSGVTSHMASVMVGIQSSKLSPPDQAQESPHTEL